MGDLPSKPRRAEDDASQNVLRYLILGGELEDEEAEAILGQYSRAELGVREYDHPFSFVSVTDDEVL